MKKISLLLLVLIALTACVKKESSVSFSDEALSKELIALDTQKVTFEQILNKYLGSVVFIDVWASWCPDCIKSFPDVKQLQTDFPDLKYVFLSVDKTEQDWKNAIEKYQLKGDHYFIEGGMKGDFGKAIPLDWIPRYIVVDKKGNVALYKAIDAKGEELITVLKKLK